MTLNDYSKRAYVKVSKNYEDFYLTEFVDEFKIAKQKIAKLQRCTKCVLPETFPYITFDADGVCNFCHSYRRKDLLGFEALKDALNKYKSQEGPIKAIVSFSGGRDSSFGLHLAKKVLGLDVIAFTYNWGGATEIAYRNQKKMCEKLGVEQITIAANLQRKRKNIRANLNAWLKKPDLAMIPMLTSVGQQFYYYANQTSKRLGRELIVLCATPYEHTYFKTGFSGLKPREKAVNLPVVDRIQFAINYAGKYLSNPSYINTSLLDSFGGYLSFYMIPHNYLRLFDYLEWNEDEVNSTLLNEYNWETSEDNPSTWRIDDATVPLSDYMYYIMAGLTINDTFRSNQIRDGVISRDEALYLLDTENIPRLYGIQKYCEMVGVDFESTMRIINKAERLYT